MKQTLVVDDFKSLPAGSLVKVRLRIGSTVLKVTDMDYILEIKNQETRCLYRGGPGGPTIGEESTEAVVVQWIHGQKPENNESNDKFLGESGIFIGWANVVDQIVEIRPQVYGIILLVNAVYLVNFRDVMWTSNGNKLKEPFA